MPEPQATGVVYRYRGEDGAWVFTNDLSSVPEALRANVEAFVPEGTTIEDTAKDAAAKVKAGAKSAKDALEGLPARADALKEASRREAEHVQREVGDVLPFVKDLDVPSVAVGFAGALVLWVASAVVRRTGRVLFKVAGILLVLALVAGAYFGWLRRAAGLSGDRLASPEAIVDDAEQAAQQFRNRLEQQQRTLRQIEESSR